MYCLNSDHSEHFSLTLNCGKILSITEGQHLRLQTNYIIWTCEYRYDLQSIIFPNIRTNIQRLKSKIVSNRLSQSFIENVVESQLEVPCWLISKNHCLLWIWKVPWMYQIHIHFRKLEMNGFTRRVYEKRSRLRYLVPNSSMISNSAYDTMPHWPVHLNDLGLIFDFHGDLHPSVLTNRHLLPHYCDFTAVYRCEIVIRNKMVLNHVLILATVRVI